MAETPQQWFIQEILPHEASLMRYIRRICPNREEAADIRQEIYAKVYELGARARPTSPRQYLFTSARNLIVDRVRRGKVVSIEIRSDLDDVNLLIDELSPERHVSARQEMKRLVKAFDALPEDCREAIWKRKVEELSQKSTAEAIGIKERVVERRLSRGIRLLAESFFGREETEIFSGNRGKKRRGHG
jgi:RNA polymerase sigma factor (sigma-70 family)